jgi:uncharacterized damage-inducible protein DinB
MLERMIRDTAPLPGYPEPYGFLCANLQDATVEWRGEMWDTDIGPDATTWRVRPGGPSIGAIILHMIVTEIFWIEHFVLGRPVEAEDWKLLMWDEIDVDSSKWPDAPNQPLSWYLDLHDRYRTRILEAIKSWPAAENLMDFHDRQVTPRWVLGHVIQHEAYHGGQIVMLYDLWKNRADNLTPALSTLGGTAV